MDARILKNMTNRELSNTLNKVYGDYELFRWGDVAMVINEVASRLADPWQTIDPADVGTLPDAIYTHIHYLAIHSPEGDYTVEGFLNGKEFQGAGIDISDYQVYAIAPKTMPDPPPYNNEVNQLDKLKAIAENNGVEVKETEYGIELLYGRAFAGYLATTVEAMEEKHMIAAVADVRLKAERLEK